MHGPDNFEAEQDLFALERAEQVQSNPTRLNAIRSMLSDKQETASKALNKLGPVTKSSFAGAAKGGSMTKKIESA